MCPQQATMLIASPVLQVAPQQAPYNAAAVPGRMAKVSLAASGVAYPQQPALVPLVPLQGTAGMSLPIAPECYHVPKGFHADLQHR